MTDGPMDFFGHRQVKPKQKIIHLSAPLAEVRDEEAETVRDQVLSDGYSASEPSDVADAKGRQESMETQTWEDAGLEHGCDQGGAISPGMMAPLTPLAEMPSDDDVDIPAASHKHASSSPLASEGLKSQKMDDDPIPTPNVKAAKAEGNINQNAEVELCHNDEKNVMHAWRMNFTFTMMRTSTLLDRQKGLDHHRSLQRNSRSWTNKLHWMSWTNSTGWMSFNLWHLALKKLEIQTPWTQHWYFIGGTPMTTG